MTVIFVSTWVLSHINLIQQAICSPHSPTLPHNSPASSILRNNSHKRMTPEEARKVAVELSQQLVALDALRTYLEQKRDIMLKRSHHQN